MTHVSWVLVLTELLCDALSRAGGFELGKPGKARAGQKFVLRLDGLVLTKDEAASKKAKNSKFVMAAPTFEALNTWMGKSTSASS